MAGVPCHVIEVTLELLVQGGVFGPASRSYLDGLEILGTPPKECEELRTEYLKAISNSKNGASSAAVNRQHG